MVAVSPPLVIAATVFTEAALVKTPIVPGNIGMSVRTAVWAPTPQRRNATPVPAFTIRMTSAPPLTPPPVGVLLTSVVSSVHDALMLLAEMDLVLEKLGLKGCTFIG
jgi:hypothetical protein